jgi:hypothetical protein
MGSTFIARWGECQMMNATRRRLPNRRGSETFDFICGGFHYIATVAFFDDGTLAEIFLFNGKAGSSTDSAAKDSAIVASLGFQFGIPIDVIRRALLRDARGAPNSPLGCALDILAGTGRPDE